MKWELEYIFQCYDEESTTNGAGVELRYMAGLFLPGGDGGTAILL